MPVARTSIKQDHHSTILPATPSINRPTELAALDTDWPTSFSKIFASRSLRTSGSMAPTGVTYFSQGGLAPNLTTSWNTLPAGGGGQPPNFTSNDIFIIQNGHNMTTTAAWAISGGQIEITSGGTLTANHLVSVTFVSGVYVSASDYADVQIDTGATLSLAAAITVSGNWTNAGTFIHNGFGVTFDGTGAQTITTGGSGAGKQFAGFTVSKSSGTATLAGPLRASALSITAGTLDTSAASSFAVIATGDVGLTSGTFAANDSTVTVGGNWSNTGTFSAGGANTVIFNGDANTQTISGATSFKNLTINHTGANNVTAAGSTLSVAGLLDVVSGTFTSATAYNNVQIDAAGTLALSGPITVSGNWTNNGGTFTPGAYSVKFNGTGITQIVRKANATEVFGDVIIEKDGGSVQLGNALRINGALQFNGTVDVLEINGSTLTLNGTVGGSNASGGLKGDLSGSQLVIGGSGALGTLRFVSGGEFLTSLIVNRASSGSVTLGSSLNIGDGSTGVVTLTNGVVDMGANTLALAGNPVIFRTNGYVIGNVQKTFGATGSFTFPVGTANGYSPLDANVTAGTGNLSVIATQTKQPSIGGTNALSRYWALSGSGITTDLTFHYLAGDVVGTEASYKIFKYSGGAFTQFTPNVLDTANHFATLNGVSSFSDWTLAEASAVQPGSLQFSAANFNDSETNLDHTAAITVTRTGGSDGVVAVHWATSAGTATAGTDYVESSGDLNWSDGDAADKTFTFTVKGDATFEPNETVHLTLSAPTGGATLGSQNTATLTIQNDDSVFTVNNANDVNDGTCDVTHCSLREAIIAANANSDANGINFNIPAATDTGCNAGTGVCTIKPGSQLPFITQPVIMDGYSQPGAVRNTLAVGSDAALKIEISGENSANVQLLRLDANNSTLAGLVLNRAGAFGGAITIGGSSNWINGNYLGTNVAGDAAAASATQYGIDLGGTNNVIGTNADGADDPAERNVMSGFRFTSIYLGDFGLQNNNTIAGNYIGTNAAGMAAIPSDEFGIFITQSSSSNTIGGTTTAARNVISGNKSGGIYLECSFPCNTTGNVIQGNFIGVGADGSTALGNIAGPAGPGHGVQTYDALNTIVGGTAAGAANVIANNAGAGVNVNYVDATTIRGNSIHDNGGLGIDRAGAGVTPNDPQDADFEQNFPLISFATAASPTNTIEGTLNSTAGKTFTIDFYQNSACDPSGNGEGQTYLGSLVTGTTDANGDVSFTFHPTTLTAGQSITATATGTDASGRTSEFSACVVAGTEAGVIKFTAPAYPIGEGGGSVAIGVMRVGSSQGTIGVTYATTDGSANDGSDYTGQTSTLSWGDGDAATKVINIPITDDIVVDGAETFTIALSLPTGGATIGIPGTAAVTITDNDVALTFAIADLTQAEGSSGSPTDFVFTVTKSGNIPVTATVNFTTQDGTATTGDGDYDLATGGLTFLSTDTSKQITIHVNGDITYEGDETFNLHLSGATNATITDADGNGTIINDDAPPATLVVNTTDDVDNGACLVAHCSLREAINAANFNSDTNTITFNIPSLTDPGCDSGTGVCTIKPLGTGLPVLTQPVTINGYSQPGATPNTLAAGEDAVFKIVLDGSSSNITNIFGLDIRGGNSTVRGLVINQWGPAAIKISINGGNTIAGNFIGTNLTGTAAAGGGGVQILNVANNTIGGTAPADRNLLNKGAGIKLLIDGANASGNLVQGNFIGTNAAGTAALGGAVGVFVTNGAYNNTIGGATAGARNIISGNNTSPLTIANANANIVQGNYIGTDVTGANALGNGGAGVGIGSSSFDNVIGGPNPGEGNIIANNGVDGSSSRRAGVIVDNISVASTRNSIRGNSIYNNATLAIDLAGDGVVTANDAGDGDSGGNDLQNFPVLTSSKVTGSTRTIRGTLNSTASSNFTIDFYANAACDTSGNGEGQTYLGSTPVTTDGSGNVSFTFNPTSLTVGDVITATATDASNNTSEFSACVATIAGTPGSLQFAATNTDNTETNSSSHTVDVAVTRTGGSDGAVSVDYNVTNGTATTADSDYSISPATGTLNWTDGDAADKNITITVNGDTLFEADETVNLTLSAPTGGASLGSQSSATLTITNDDAAPALGTYPDTTVALGANATVTPDAVPTNATSINVASSTNFKGTFTADPATGVVRVTNAHPAGIYTVTVTAFNGPVVNTTKTFTLTVQTGTACTGVSFFTNAADSSGYTNPQSVAIGDFNSDGKQDIAVANFSGNTVSIRLGDGAGGFTGTSNVSVGNTPYSVAVGDFNNDGKQDIAATNFNPSTVSIRLGDGLGGFTGTTNVSVGTAPRSIAIGDFNNDGKQDFAVANENSNTVSIPLGDGAGGFSGTTNVSVGTSPYSVAIGDFNNDGKQDFAVANVTSATVSIRLGDGAGGFSGTTNVMGSLPYAVAIGDFNNDGKQDIAAASRSLGTVSIRLGDGLGGFSGPTDVSVGSGPESVAIGDFNNDGKQDIATANEFSNTVSIRLGDGLGGFSGTTNIGVGSHPVSVAIGDFNGDGKQDFAAADSMSASVSIRLGACNAAPTIAAATGLSRQQGSPVGNSQIATVTDDGGNGSVSVSVTTANPSNGVSVSNITNTGGNITADIVADCTATTATFTLQASDGSATATDTLTVTVTPNTAPTLTYASPQSVAFGGALNVTPTTASDNGTITGYAVQAGHGLTTAPTVDASGVVSITTAHPSGAHTITIRATDNCGALTDAAFTLNVGYQYQLSISTSGPGTVTSAPSGINCPGTCLALYNSGTLVTLTASPADGSTFVGWGGPACSGTLTTCNVTMTQARTVTATFVDTTPPDTTLTVTEPDPTTDPTGDFEFTSTEAGGTFECRVDSGSFVPCTSPHSTAALAPGSHTFYVRAIDAAGNIDPTPASHTWAFYPPPTLGDYPETMVDLSGDTTVTPGAAPTNATRINVASSTNFKGTFSADPATGVVRVTNAHPAGTYTVTVTAFNGSVVNTTKTFTLTVQTGTACTGASLFTNAADSSVGSNPYSVAIGDFNNDGKQDIAAANESSDNVSIRLGDGLGGFSGTTNVSVGTGPVSVAIGDFNGDGKQDFAAANYFSNTVVSIRLGDGLGGFTVQPDVSVGTNPDSVAIGDFNNDGKQDIATANNSSATVSIRLGDGAGGFSGTTNVGVGANPYSVAIGDFNNDGKQDIAAANYGSNTVSIRLGDGVGGFTGTTDVSVGSLPYSVAIGDFNNDGKQDIATANNSSATVSIRLGDGAGGFSGTTNVGVGANPYSVAIGDFNNDGKQDIAAANQNSHTVSIRLGDGLGGFSGTTNVSVGASPFSVAIGDFNGDGKQDFAAANEGSTTVSIRLGQCNLSPTITAATGLSRQQGTPVSNSQIATVTDDGGNGSVSVTVTSTNPSNGVTITNVVNTGGNVTADIVASCTATNATFTLQASDGSSTVTDTLTVTVTANTAPTLTYASPQTVIFGGLLNVSPTSSSDNGTVTYSVQSGHGLTTAPTVDASGVVSITNAQPAGAHTVTIRATDNCGALTDAAFTLNVGAVPTFAIDDVTHNEGNAGTTSYTFTVTRTGGTALSSAVNFTTVDGTATTANSDYQAQSGTLNFLAADTTKQITVLVNGDTAFEPDEVLTVHLSGASGATISDADGSATIRNDDSVPTFAIDDVTHDEGNAGTTSYTFTVTRTGSTALSSNVDYATVNGTATAPSDFTAIPTTTLTFLPADTTRQFTVLVNGDPTVEANEVFTVHLSNAVNATISDADGTGTITNDDTDVSVAVLPASVAEDGATNLAYTFTRNGVTTGALTVNFSVGGDAVFGTDYTQTGAATFTPPSGTVTFGAGNPTAIVTIDPTPDLAFEDNETVILTVTSGTAYNVASPTSATGTINNDDAVGGLVRFSSASYNTTESSGSTTITVERLGDTTEAVTVEYATPDDSEATTVVSCTTINNLASPRCDFTTALGKLRFAVGETSKTFTVLISQDRYVEGDETLTLTLSNLTGGAVFGVPSTATLTIADDLTEPATNPIDVADNFVRQHYHDFLNREPDAGGLGFWTNQITQCGADAQCTEVNRINVSGAFYLSIEFQNTGYLAVRLYKTSYGDAMGSSEIGGTHQMAVPMVRFSEFLRDTQTMGQGVVVGQGDWETVLESNKQAFVAEFVQSSRFTTAFMSMTPAQFVAALNTNAGNPLSPAELADLTAEHTAGTKTRAQVLREIAEHPNLIAAESNRAFVLMQYFGYLRRNPNAAPDSEYSGYDFWLTKLNNFNGNFHAAEMVKAFISSIEYRQRFGP